MFCTFYFFIKHQIGNIAFSVLITSISDVLDLTVSEGLKLFQAVPFIREKLETLDLNEMPKYIVENYDKYKPWLDNS